MKSFVAILFAGLLSSPLAAATSSMTSSMTSMENDGFFSHDRMRPRRVLCIAKSGRGDRGDLFRAVGYDRYDASREALQRCRRQSLRPFTCHIVSCRRLGDRDND